MLRFACAFLVFVHPRFTRCLGQRDASSPALPRATCYLGWCVVLVSRPLCLHRDPCRLDLRARTDLRAVSLCVSHCILCCLGSCARLDLRVA
ncbi:villin-5-like isoform X2 [Iris pallida]|uniref:Villin-5-like isoform X2 n=1 Tax=Iris pallida TaxID=29817 RepID=A0AAX6EWQ3_IRIPA|nr:villin-5-like isoform X2 [Iris pallida]